MQSTATDVEKNLNKNKDGSGNPSFFLAKSRKNQGRQPFDCYNLIMKDNDQRIVANRQAKRKLLGNGRGVMSCFLYQRRKIADDILIVGLIEWSDAFQTMIDTVGIGKSEIELQFKVFFLDLVVEGTIFFLIGFREQIRYCLFH